MPQPRSPKIDWLLQAWKLSTVLIDVPDRPLITESFGNLPLNSDAETFLQELRQRLNDSLNFSMAKQLGAAKAKQYRFDGDARTAIARRNELKEVGITLNHCDQTAIYVHAQINFILQRRYLDNAARIALPVTVASIAGKSAALQNAISSAYSRRKEEREEQEEQQQDPLEGVILYLLEADSQATFNDVFDQLTSPGAEVRVLDVIKEFRDGIVYYYDAKDKVKPIGRDRVKTLFHKLRRSG